jgi:hypothetical protein
MVHYLILIIFFYYSCFAAIGLKGSNADVMARVHEYEM